MCFYSNELLKSGLYLRLNDQTCPHLLYCSTVWATKMTAENGDAVYELSPTSFIRHTLMPTKSQQVKKKVICLDVVLIKCLCLGSLKSPVFLRTH